MENNQPSTSKDKTNKEKSENEGKENTNGEEKENEENPARDNVDEIEEYLPMGGGNLLNLDNENNNGPGGGGVANNDPDPPGDEIDVMDLENPFAQPPVIDFNQLDNALQHVQGHMDNMMHNLGGLQSSVKHLKQNLSHYMQRSSEVDRNALRVSLHADIVQSWKDGTFSDLTLVDDAGIQHKVHKVVLASRSSYFRAQLTNWDKDEKVLNVKIVSSEILKVVIEFIYTLDVQKQINNSNVVDLLQAANIYDLKLLREECVHFLKHRISISNIIEILSFSHIDPKLEIHATDFLARNFSKFLLAADKKVEVLELPVDKMKLVLKSKLLILRDKFMFPVKAVTRESTILAFVLEYIKFREKPRLIHSGELLSSVRFHLLPLDETLSFSSERFLPEIITEFIETKLSSHGEIVKLLIEIEKDVRYLHTHSDKSQLYQNTFSNLVYVSGDNKIRTIQKKEVDDVLGDRNPNWDAACNREASISHEWWTAHAHDSRFIPSGNNRNTKIIAVSGSGDCEKFLKKITFYIGDVNDNHDLLPEWFHLAPQYSIQNMQQELGEYIGAINVEWSNGKENWIGGPADLNKEKVTVSLEEGEHIIKSYQLFWGPRQVFVPLEVVDFVFVTSKGRKFGPFTKQVRKLYHEAEGQKKEWSFTDIRHKLNSKKIQRRVDNPLNPMCRPASIGELSSSAMEADDDMSWSVWLDGFLCVTKNEKITRITLKFAVYLDCLYKEKKKPKCPPNKPQKDCAPVLLSYTLEDLRNNIQGKPIRIHDYEYLWDNMITPYADPEIEENRCKRLRKMLDWNESGLVTANHNAEENAENAQNEANEDDRGAPIYNMINDILEPNDLEENINANVANLNANVDNNNQNDGDNENNNNGNNNNEQNVVEEHDENDAEGGNDNEGDHLHGDVWDALINDDLRAIGQLYERRQLKIEEYLE
eukprot:TRINITY_DN9582_c0_g1_i1.p1 TRINITY_DN9582_c0_g1~~TRINITY_DN9582_c0_g1_i1.p1  ORF type:complete len:933 (-),score=247.46 TRINITY_DN9582_c0_g1_i1:82-2880(-)